MSNNPLQSSGAISFGNINLELGRAVDAELSIYLAESGTYGAINGYSGSRPSGTQPSPLSEWYGYNHAALPPYRLLINYQVTSSGTADSPCGAYSQSNSKVFAALVDSTTGAPVSNTGSSIDIVVRTENYNTETDETTYGSVSVSIINGASTGESTEFADSTYVDLGSGCVLETITPISVDSISTTYEIYYEQSAFPKTNYEFGTVDYLNEISINTDSNTKSYTATTAISTTTNQITISNHGFSTGEEVTFSYSGGGSTPTGYVKTFTVSGLNLIDNTITAANHNLQTGDKIVFTGTSVLENYTTSIFTNSTAYYAIRVTKDKFAVATTLNNALTNVKITFTPRYDFTSADIEPLLGPAPTFTPTGTDDIFIAAGGLPTGTPVLYIDNYYLQTGGASLTGLVHNTVYYIVRIDTAQIKLATTYANATATPTPITLSYGLASGIVSGTFVYDVRLKAANSGNYTFTQSIDPGSYYIVKVDDNNIKLSTQFSNVFPPMTYPAAYVETPYPPRTIDFTATGTGTHTLVRVSSVNTGTGTITYNNHTLTNNLQITYNANGGTPIGGLTSGNTYFVKYVDANNFQLSTTSGGSAISLTSAGTGSNHTFTLTDANWQQYYLFANCGPGFDVIDLGCGVFNDYTPNTVAPTGRYTSLGEYTFNTSTAGVVSVVSNTISLPYTYIPTGKQVVYNTQGNTTIGGLTNGNTYYLKATGTGTISGSPVVVVGVASSLANAQSSTFIDLTATGSGIHKFVIPGVKYRFFVRNGVVYSKTTV